MKFADGFWLNQRGYTVDYAVQPYDIQISENAVRVFATSQTIYNRGMTLGGVTLTFEFSAVREDTIRIKIVHHKGAADHTPKFELNTDDSFKPVITEDENSVTLCAGKTAVTITKGNAWQIRYTYDGRLLTGCGWRAASYIQENAFVTENRMHTASDNTFWSIPENRCGSYIREQLSLSVGEYIYGFGEKFTPFVKNGQTVDIWNSDGGTCSDQSYKCVPFYLSSRSYGVFANQTGRVSYEVASDTVSKVSMTVPGESLEYFIIGGKSCADVLRNYTGLTGRPALTPADSLGLWLSTSFSTDYDEQTVTGFLSD